MCLFVWCSIKFHVCFSESQSYTFPAPFPLEFTANSVPQSLLPKRRGVGSSDLEEDGLEGTEFDRIDLDLVQWLQEVNWSN